MRKYKSDIIIACVIILILTYFIPAPNILHYGIIIFLIFVGLPKLNSKEEDFWENQKHDENRLYNEEEQEQAQETQRQRSAFSLRADESQFWENRPHDEEEQKTDYSQVDPCFRGDKRNNLL